MTATRDIHDRDGWYIQRKLHNGTWTVTARGYASESLAKAAAARDFKSPMFSATVQIVNDDTDPPQVLECRFDPGTRAKWARADQQEGK